MRYSVRAAHSSTCLGLDSLSSRYAVKVLPCSSTEAGSGIVNVLYKYKGALDKSNWSSQTKRQDLRGSSLRGGFGRRRHRVIVEHSLDTLSRTGRQSGSEDKELLYTGIWGHAVLLYRGHPSSCRCGHVRTRAFGRLTTSVDISYLGGKNMHRRGVVYLWGHNRLEIPRFRPGCS